MVVEDSQKSTITDGQNPSKVDNFDDDLEDGEILDDGDDAASGASKPPSDLIRNPHPLENSWTFWFDNPSAKSKQVAWGSSIRPIYTFATVEEFWRSSFDLFPSPFVPPISLLLGLNLIASFLILANANPCFLFHENCAAFTITFTTRVSWVCERTFTALSIRLSPNGRTLSAPMVENGL